MAKLKCRQHKRRVVVVGYDTTLHRNDGSACDSLLQIGSEVYEPREVKDREDIRGGGFATGWGEYEQAKFGDQGAPYLGEPGSGATWERVLGNDETHD